MRGRRPSIRFGLAGRRPAAWACVAVCGLAAAPVQAHGVAGNRFFPATLATDDPAVADELSLPTVSRFKTGDDPAANETDVAAEYSKRLTPKLGISFGGAWTRLDAPGEPAATGFQNLETTIKYQLLTSAPHEAIVSAGLSVEWGGTGSDAVGAEHTTTLTPTVYFGKGAGDLPDGLSWARPLAMTGVVGYALPARGGDRVLTTGVAVEYSLGYLSAHVRDLGLPYFVNQLTPLVEAAFQTPVTGAGGPTTGTINPGIIWSGRHFQVAIEAIAPINRQSGKTIGGVIQLHLFLDDLFPHSIGRPIW